MSLLPSNSTTLERALEATTQRVGTLPVPLRNLWDVDTCPANLLPWLAWTLSVDVWDPAWTEAQKRSVIRNAIYVHRHKGTRAALETALASLSYLTTITEWWETDGVAQGLAPYTFLITVEAAGQAIDSAAYNQITAIIDSAKNVRSSYTLNVNTAASDAWYAAGVTYDGDEVTIYPGA